MHPQSRLIRVIIHFFVFFSFFLFFFSVLLKTDLDVVDIYFSLYISAIIILSPMLL